MLFRQHMRPDADRVKAPSIEHKFHAARAASRLATGTDSVLLRLRGQRLISCPVNFPRNSTNVFLSHSQMDSEPLQIDFE
jgi:hypothetical protein